MGVGNKKIIKQGDTFHYLTILEEISNKSKYNFRYVKVKCKCGNIKVLRFASINSGGTKSCGCLMKKHGLTKTRFYNIWAGLTQRTGNSKSDAYYNYGGRGIKCEWINFEEFKSDMYESYLEHCKEFGEKETTIDRINSNGDYCKENCRWATYKEQANNRRSSLNISINTVQLTIKNKIITLIRKNIIWFNGEGNTIMEWSKILNINYSKVTSRISVMNWSALEALELVERKNQGLHKNKLLGLKIGDSEIVGKEKNGIYILKCKCGNLYKKTREQFNKLKRHHCGCLYVNSSKFVNKNTE